MTIFQCYIGQVPARFLYQVVLRDANNIVLKNQPVAIRFSILQGGIGGSVIYTELFSTSSNDYGLINLEIGSGTTMDDLSMIDWTNHPYFLETAVDFSGGSSWIVTGTSQLLSVPYAFHANTADSIIGINALETDPIFMSSIASTINSSDTALWNNYIDTDTQIDSIGIANYGYVAGPHTIDTDTQIDSIGIANYGYVAGPHTIDTDTQIDSIGIANYGYVAEQIYSTGMYPELGGYVFRISPDGKHGLVVETQDQSISPTNWYEASNIVSDPSNHSINGQFFSNWRVPTISELNEIFLQRLSIGGSFNLNYWSSSQFDIGTAMAHSFDPNSVVLQSGSGKNNLKSVRSVREF